MNTSDKLLSTLGLFTLAEPEWTVEDAARRLGLAVSTTYRYVRSLNDAGLIVTYAPGRYVLGPAIIALDRQARLLDPLIRTATPVMRRVVEDVPGPCVLLLCRLFRDSVMCVHQEPRDRPDWAVAYERGRPMPLHRGAASRPILANLPARFVRAYHRDHAADMAALNLGPDWDDVKRTLGAVRRAGLLVTHAELDPGVTGIGAPILGPDGTAIGSLALVLRHGPDLAARIAAAGPPLRAGAAAVTGGMVALVALGKALPSPDPIHQGPGGGPGPASGFNVPGRGGPASGASSTGDIKKNRSRGSGGPARSSASRPAGWVREGQSPSRGRKR